MNRALFVRGAGGGLLAGIVMAMWSMIVLWLIGNGFWTALNLIAHTFWRDAPLDATFSWGALIIGLIVHMMMSIALGVGLAVALAAIPRVLSSPVASVTGGMVFGIAAWLVMQYGIWPAVDTAAADQFTPWVFAIGHLMYGLVAALVISIPATRQAGSQPAH